MQIKVKVIMPRDSPIKCKVSDQIFIKEISNKFKFNKPIVQFNKVSLDKFKDIAYKINVHFSPGQSNSLRYSYYHDWFNFYYNIFKSHSLNYHQYIQMNQRRWCNCILIQ